jgi:hypothetical protein
MFIKWKKVNYKGGSNLKNINNNCHTKTLDKKRKWRNKLGFHIEGDSRWGRSYLGG